MTRRKPPREEIFQRRKLLAEQAARGELRLPAAVLQLRHALGLTQTEFAALYGMTRRQIADLETVADANPKLETLKRIARIFGFDVGFVPRVTVAPKD